MYSATALNPLKNPKRIIMTTVNAQPWSKLGYSYKVGDIVSHDLADILYCIQSTSMYEYNYFPSSKFSNLYTQTQFL